MVNGVYKYIRTLAKANILSIIIVICLSGCTTLSDEERAWRHGIDAENWEMCLLVYKQNDVPTIHYEHTHKYKNRVRPWDISSDLRNNRCRSILKDYWIHY